MIICRFASLHTEARRPPAVRTVAVSTRSFTTKGTPLNDVLLMAKIEIYDMSQLFNNNIVLSCS